MGAHTMPRAFDFDPETASRSPSILLAGEPKLEDRGPQQTVTYKINPEAVWSDGEPITSTDFKYTWDQIANGNDIYDKTGYEDIESVDDSDPKTAVVTFSDDVRRLEGPLRRLLRHLSRRTSSRARTATPR